MLDFEPPGINFLLPHGTWDAPPSGRRPDGSTPYGDWLIELFDFWYSADELETRIRLFEEIIRLLLGGRSRTEAVGLSPVSVVVVETNGQIEQVDSLKSTFEGATQTPLHISRDPFNAALLLPSIAARQIRGRALLAVCHACEIEKVCGGLYAHCYRSGGGFRNPSVYCHNLFRLITHIRQAVRADLTRV